MNKILKLSAGVSSIEDLVGLAAKFLKNGQIIAIPTDTIYGLAVDARNSVAIQRLYDVKGRDFQKPFAICVGSIGEIFKYSQVTVPEALLEELLPGAVTVMFRRSDALPPFLNPSAQLVGIRIPAYSFVQELCRELQAPIALTSANVSNHSSSLTIEDFRSIWTSIDAIVDGGELGEIDPERHGSTIVDLSTVGHFRIVRDGCVLRRTLDLLLKYHLKRLD